MGTERTRELRRRRQRKKKLLLLRKKCVKANKSEKAVIAQKLRRLTPGAEFVIESLGIKN